MRNGTGTRDRSGRPRRQTDVRTDPGRPDPARVALRVLGTFEATVDGRPVSLGGPRQRAVLARVLVADGAAVPAEQIVDDVWGGQGVGGSTPSSVHVYVSRLRRALGGEAISRRTGGYVLDRRVVAVDADAFVADVARGRRLLARGDDETAAGILAAALDRWVGPAGLRRPGQRAVPGDHHRAAGGAAGERGRDAGRRARPPRPGRPATWPCSRSWPRSTRCASRWRCAWSPPCTRPAGRPTRWPRSSAAGARWPTSWASTRRRRCAGCTPPCWPRRRR